MSIMSIMNVVSINYHNQIVSYHYDLIAESFDTSRVRIWNSVKEFLNDSSNKINLLDCGCGNGKNMVYASKLGYDCVGFDISNKLLDICKSKGLDVFYCDIINDNIINEKFNKIISIAVLHHLETIELQKKAIMNLINLLEPGGELLISFWSLETGINDTKRDYRDFKLGPNYVDWKLNKNKTIKRFYYIHDYKSIINLIKDIPDITYVINWEFQNWFVKITNNNS